MQSRLICLGVLAASLTYAPHARADAYDVYIERLEKSATTAARGGFTSNELQNLKRDISQKPAGHHPHSYKRFIRMIERLEKTMRRGGFVKSEKEAMSMLVMVKPTWTGSLTPQDYQIFLNIFAEMIRGMHRGGFTMKELAVSKMVESVAPTKGFPKVGYDRSYKIWSSHLSRLERTFQSGGLKNRERQMLDRFRKLQPQRVQEPTKMARPQLEHKVPTIGLKPPLPKPTVPTGPFKRSWCRQEFHVKSERQRPRERKRKSVIQLMHLVANDQLVEVDTGKCRIRWITDDIRATVPLKRVGFYVAIRKNGDTYLVDPASNVFRLGSNFVSGEVPATSKNPNFFQLKDRAGGVHTVELTGKYRANLSRLTVRMNGTQKFITQLYQPTSRPLPEPR